MGGDDTARVKSPDYDRLSHPPALWAGKRGDKMEKVERLVEILYNYYNIQNTKNKVRETFKQLFGVEPRVFISDGRVTAQRTVKASELNNAALLHDVVFNLYTSAEDRVPILKLEVYSYTNDLKLSDSNLIKEAFDFNGVKFYETHTSGLFSAIINDCKIYIKIDYEYKDDC